MELRMKKLLLLFTIIIASQSFAQTDKQIDKSIKVFRKDYAKGIKKLNKYMDKHSYPAGRAWNVLVEMEYLNFLNLEEKYGEIFVSIEVVGDTTEEDRKTLEFMELLTQFPRNNFLKVCRDATILSQSAYGDYYLRQYNIEINPDTNNVENALEYFEEGDEFYEKEDYELAILNYKKALKVDSNYYSASMQLGKSFLAKEENDSAIFYFNVARTIKPNFLAPTNFIIEILIEEGLYFRAKKECLIGLCVYPGMDLKLKYQKILYVEDKYMQEHRLLRGFFPNNMEIEDQGVLNGTFSSYRAAKSKISKYCDENGVIEKNGVTDDQYLEVYSWHKLLKSLDDDLPELLEFAQDMDEEGYLDCYVLVSNFHYDIYPQFKHFMSDEANREKTKTYVEKYLIKSIN
jgi:tetratricopeptide (TPR) repeat protein